MPDRRRERQSTDDNNPFAPPPEGQPDQPWQPRRPQEEDSRQGSGEGRGRWSPRQPGRSSDGFGRRPERQDQGPGGNPDGPGLRWDPTDPAQRRARYALLAGMWAFFFAIFDLSEIALLLGALALYWGTSSLRAKPKQPAPGVTTPPAPPGGAPATARPQRTAAISGLVTAGLALVIVAASFTVHMVYRDYYTCVDDALTKTGQLSCNELLPDPLQDVFGVQE
ncbi:hypothetical protein [Streptomyces purpureus]|uniref:Integral membrane protein n=1 Tax=Streptomyces purpureus TaxID=1951 RepID=A0A918HHD2_9ACTN|nr:hypothetical protein [Streptomyces purpureus]GGT58837.1 hypothetical protein GCM10014713_60490 [Streptomyces purpureus]